MTRLSDHERLFLKNLRNSSFTPKEKSAQKSDPPRNAVKNMEERIRKLEKEVYELRMKEHHYIEEITGYKEEISKLNESFRKKTAMKGINSMKSVSTSALARQLNMNAKDLFSKFMKSGWIIKNGDNWELTPAGIQQGGVYIENPKYGKYIAWPENIMKSDEPEPVRNDSGFREKFEAKHRATDGHYVRSKAEMLIDNWLYMEEIVHTYEKKLPVEEEAYSDFYLPTGKVYIEYWGYENDSKYMDRKRKKQEIYSKYGFKLIELEERDVQNLDDIMPNLLLKNGMQPESIRNELIEKNSEIEKLKEELVNKENYYRKNELAIKSEIERIKEELTRRENHYRENELAIFRIICRFILSENKLNQETVNKILKLSKDICIKSEDAKSILKDFIEKKKAGNL